MMRCPKLPENSLCWEYRQVQWRPEDGQISLCLPTDLTPEAAQNQRRSLRNPMSTDCHRPAAQKPSSDSDDSMAQGKLDPEPAASRTRTSNASTKHAGMARMSHLEILAWGKYFIPRALHGDLSRFIYSPLSPAPVVKAKFGVLVAPWAHMHLLGTPIYIHLRSSTHDCTTLK